MYKINVKQEDYKIEVWTVLENGKTICLGSQATDNEDINTIIKNLCIRGVEKRLKIWDKYKNNGEKFENLFSDKKYFDAFENDIDVDIIHWEK